MPRKYNISFLYPGSCFGTLSKLIVLAMVLAVCSCTESRRPVLDVIPTPREIVAGRGSLDLKRGLDFIAPDSALTPAVSYLKKALASDGIDVNGTVPVSIATNPAISPAEYRLAVNGSGIEITGGSYESIISASSTLRQMLWSDSSRLPYMKITDAPRFAWRGVMLDVSRHFFTVEEVKSLIDEMALYKFNKLHLHLTDDQGWRLEIKSHPELTLNGAWRTLDKNDSTCLKLAEETKDAKFLLPADRMREGLYGGYYTQDEMRGIIAYAEKRAIEIVPEIDMPGHSLTVLKSFPALSCDGKGGAWGQNFSTPLCLGNDDVLSFCKSVLDEVFELFPSEYVHIGGDEVERTAWEHCSKCKARVENQKLGGIENLQAWFTRQIDEYCTSRGKRIIGWDEVAYDGLSAGSIVMWWRSWSPASLIKSIVDGHQVIICPSEYYYLVDEQDRNSLEKVYEYEPDDGRADNYPGSVAGIQGNLWCEKSTTIERCGERMFPRLFAIAESAWTEPEAKDYGSFLHRLPAHLRKLNEAGWKYRMADVNGVYDRNVLVGETALKLSVPEGAELYYTLDGSVPDTSSLRYNGSITLKDSCLMRYRCYNDRSVADELNEALFVVKEYLPAISNVTSMSPGLLVRWYDFKGDTCADIDSAPLKDNFILRGIAIPEDVSGDIGLIFNGYFQVRKDGVYAFYTYSDDGSTLSIDDYLVVDNDGLHSRTEKTGSVALRKGWHKFTLKYFDSNGGVLEAGMTDSDGRHLPFASDSFKH